MKSNRSRSGATSDPAETDRLSADYDALLSRISAGAEFDLGAARAALGIEHIGPEATLGQLSGGEMTRLGLLDLVAASPDLMLLDEPTNNLDVAGLAWLGMDTDIRRVAETESVGQWSQGAESDRPASRASCGWLAIQCRAMSTRRQIQTSSCPWT